MTEIELAELPKPESVEVELEPADSSVKFTVVGKKVIFSKAPNGQTVVKVSYTPL
jgi:copper chaperone CopZ